MPKPKNKQNPDDGEIKIRPGKSSLAEFVKKPLPSEEENKEFEEMAEEEARDGEVEESLTEIYQDDKGKVADVKKLHIKKKRGGFFWLSVFLFFILVIGTSVWVYYNLYLFHGTNPEAVDFTISAPQEVLAGEEFLYVINYKNLENIDLGNIEIKVIYPDNFIFLDSSPAPVLGSSTKNNINIWRFSELKAHRSSKIQIKGKIIGHGDAENIILADMIYTPANFTSEFKKSASGESIISDIGIYFDFEAMSSVLVGEENEIIVSYRARENNFLSNFRLAIEPLENMEFIKISEDKESVRPGIWQINDIVEEEKEVKIKFKFNEKINNYEELKLRFESSLQISKTDEAEDKEYYTFLEKSIEIEILESDLSLNLIINGSRSDQGINFDQTLNYSIVYANKGETAMKDIIIMAVMESDFLDWSSLRDENKGKVKNNTISWGKEEIPVLAELNPSIEGIIDFFIKVKEITELDLDKEYQVKSYAQFSIGSFGDEEGGDKKETGSEDTRSNTIINKINSDLNLSEKIRYFNEDNIAVGSGPLPPKVGETTIYKIYWVLTNNLHELNNTQVVVNLPDYLKWEDKHRASVGTIKYNSQSHQVSWYIGRLPISVHRFDAEFNIGITPTRDDVNKIMILLPGTIVQAVDSETNAEISKTTPAKTTRLEDDEIAVGLNGDGRVME